MAESWRDWEETKRLQLNMRLLLSRPNGRKIANHLLEHTKALLDYKANRKGVWSHAATWKELLGER